MTISNYNSLIRFHPAEHRTTEEKVAEKTGARAAIVFGAIQIYFQQMQVMNCKKRRLIFCNSCTTHDKNF